MSLYDGLAPCYEIGEQGVDWPMGLDCEGWRLPTEAEWEYLARANGQFAFAGSDNPVDVAWFSETSDREPPAVAGRQPNAWGLYDMSGGVWEWVWEAPSPYPDTSVVDPVGDADGQLRVVRGGSWLSAERDIRVAARGRSLAGEPSDDVGFRLVRRAD